jgi:GR25 family glycosyltransferase involved in LPS biosynthesis
MECVYLNMDHQVARRKLLEDNFAACKLPDWHLTRIPAVGIDEVARQGIPGRLREIEKAVILSHCKALAHVMLDPGHTLILEDDALLGPLSCERIQSAAGVFPEEAWDLILTDVSIVEAHAMVRLFSVHRELAKSGEEMLIPLRDFFFSGTSSFLVNRRFKSRMLQLLRSQPSMDLPIDLFLRELIAKGEVRAFFTFPFVTSLSGFGDDSQTQLKDTEVTDMVWNTFRRFMWLHRDIDSAIAPVEQLGADFVDAETQAFIKLVGAALSTRLAYK